MDEGGHGAAAIASLIGAARLNGLNPEACRRDVLERIARGHTIDRLDDLLPWNIRPAAAR